jgi:hypothetical protein
MTSPLIPLASNDLLCGAQLNRKRQGAFNYRNHPSARDCDDFRRHTLAQHSSTVVRRYSIATSSNHHSHAERHNLHSQHERRDDGELNHAHSLAATFLWQAEAINHFKSFGV